MTRPLAIFDVDGTIIDSRKIIATSMHEAFASLGLMPPSYDQARRVVGLSLEPALAALAPDLTDRQFADLKEAYVESFRNRRERSHAFIEPMYPGARELLDALRADGWLIGMATGKSRRGVDSIIDMHQLADYFDASLCADDGASKPDPFMVRENLVRTSTDPRMAVMIGDTTFDVLMGKAAGVATIGVTWGFHTVDEIETAGPDLLAHAFEDLDQHLRAFAAGLEPR